MGAEGKRRRRAPRLEARASETGVTPVQSPEQRPGWAGLWLGFAKLAGQRAAHGHACDTNSPVGRRGWAPGPGTLSVLTCTQSSSPHMGSPLVPNKSSNRFSENTFVPKSQNLSHSHSLSLGFPRGREVSRSNLPAGRAGVGVSPAP